MLRRLSLSSRLTLALSASALLLLGGGGFWQVSAEESDLRVDAILEGNAARILRPGDRGLGSGTRDECYNTRERASRRKTGSA